MAELSTIARPYAEAAFRLAHEINALPAWADALSRLAAVAMRPEALELMGNPKLSSQQIAGVVADTAGTLTVEQMNFVQVLARNERLAVLPNIAQQFNALRSVQDGMVDVHVASAYPLSEAQSVDIQKTLEAKTGKKVKVIASVDASLIGGVSIRIGDEVTDLSVKGKLAQLQKALAA